MIDPLFRDDVAWVLHPSNLAWIEGENAADGTGLGCNRHYRDLRGTTWEDVDEALEIEGCLLAQASRGDPGSGSLGSQQIMNLDVGVAGATLALAAVGCVPFTSCNGGALGGYHDEVYPLVAFYLPKRAVETILGAAKEAGVGLFQDEVYGTVHLYAKRLVDLLEFARLLCALRNEPDQPSSQRPLRE